ncbi:MAG: FkbM family methyltransferase [Ruminococcaceae bacterium]|nr:FkbM family methyltransferase [Oscillospiraceae bacterium]
MIKEAITDLVPITERLKSQNLPIFLYGMGDGAEKINSYLQRNGIETKGVVASDGFVRGQVFLGHKVISISEAKERFGKLCLVLCFGLEGERSHFLKPLSVEHTLISPNISVFGDSVCDKEYIFENEDRFERVYNMLSDDKSKSLFLNLLKYNITGDIEYLDIEDSESAPEGFYRHSSRHIDIGAYDGDTVIEFIKHNGSYLDIVAFEPDKNSFKKFKRNTSEIRDCIGVNAAVGQKNGYIHFASGGGRASHATDDGDSVLCYSVDEYCENTHIKANGVPVGSIKIDAEGMDEEAICGAVNTIYRCRPSVSVALYHRSSDLIELPLLLRNHCSKYSFYLRKKEYVPAWDVFFYAVPKERE